jgi:hypothetical protein
LPKKKQAVTQKWVENPSSLSWKQVSLGSFARFDRERCRWRIENGTSDPLCTWDAYGRPRRRGWVNLECNASVEGRAALVAVSEPVSCEYELTVQTPEVCGVP